MGGDQIKDEIGGIYSTHGGDGKYTQYFSLNIQREMKIEGLGRKYMIGCEGLAWVQVP
jgi:hypothetical protein